MKYTLTVPPELVLGTRVNRRIPKADQERQRAEAVEVLRRLEEQPGVILADEVGMGKTFVALAVAYSVAVSNPKGPVIIMVPPNLVEKWEQDLGTFCDLYLDDREPVRRDRATSGQLRSRRVLLYGVARHSVALMKLLDDAPRERSHLVFLAQGAMGRRQTDKWVRLALIAEALRRHARGRANRLIKVKASIHRFLAQVLQGGGEERAHDLGQDLWKRLLRESPDYWKETYNSALRNQDYRLDDDPVPKSVTRTLKRMDLKPLATALGEMPLRARGGDSRVQDRVVHARHALRRAEEDLWKEVLAGAGWQSPLLVMDEAHHLKNPATLLARQLQSPESDQDLRTGDGAMARAFDRMLFLTATPFQLGHRELIHVLERFGDVRWSVDELGDLPAFSDRLKTLAHELDESQRTAIHLERTWSRLSPEDVGEDVESWWRRIKEADGASLTVRERAILDAFEKAAVKRRSAESALRPWVIRHNKGSFWPGTEVRRRQRVEGGRVTGDTPGGLPIPPQQLLPFFLAARSAAGDNKDILGGALCSSFEAFRHTRQQGRTEVDDQDEPAPARQDLAHSNWYLAEFDEALERVSGAGHPKVNPTVRKVVDLWETGEKVLVFAFYRQTCRALRIHISHEIERRLYTTVRRRLKASGGPRAGNREIRRLLRTIQRRYFDDSDGPGRRAVDGALNAILDSRKPALDRGGVDDDQLQDLLDVMRRFLRVQSTLARSFPLRRIDSIRPDLAVRATLDRTDGSGVSWREKFERFIEFLTDYCSPGERHLYLEAAKRTQTGSIRVKATHAEPDDAGPHRTTMANVQVATGGTARSTRARLMRAFNTPFFPDILVCSEVMGEGVDLQRFCRHVVHHDLAWNPSAIEQRTGRIDRIGCKAEGRQPIFLYLPYIAGAADERQFKVMTDREHWFRVVMGQKDVANLITADTNGLVPLPDGVSQKLSFRLGL